MGNVVTLNWRAKQMDIEQVDSIDEDFYICGNKQINPQKHPFKVDMTICCICLKGEVKGRIDLMPYTAKAPSISITLPGQILEYESNTADFDGVFIFMSQRFNDSLHLPDRFSTFLSVRNNPVIPLGVGQLEAIRTYYTMIRRVVGVKDNPNRLEIVKHLTIAFFYGLGYYFHKYSKVEMKTRNEILMRDFLKQVQLYHKKERRIDFYADKLHLSSKYLSQLIKNYSGKSAAEWIDEYIVLEAMALLKSTDMTVQEISDELNFPSQSFFGKFFKRVSGVSPKAYRGQ